MGHHGGLLCQRTVALWVELAPRFQFPTEVGIALTEHIHSDGLTVIARTQSYETQRLFLPVARQAELRQGEHIGLLLRQSAACGVEQFFVDIHQHVADNGVASQLVMRRVRDNLHVAVALLLPCADDALVVLLVVLTHQGQFLFAHFRLFTLPSLAQGGVGGGSVGVFTLPSLSREGHGGGSAQTLQRLFIGFVHFFARGTGFQSKHRQGVIYTHPSHVGFFLCCHQRTDLRLRHAHQRVALTWSQFPDVEIAHWVRWVLLALQVRMPVGINFCNHCYLVLKFIFNYYIVHVSAADASKDGGRYPPPYCACYRGRGTHHARWVAIPLLSALPDFGSYTSYSTSIYGVVLYMPVAESFPIPPHRRK